MTGPDLDSQMRVWARAPQFPARTYIKVGIPGSVKVVPSSPPFQFWGKIRREVGGRNPLGLTPTGLVPALTTRDSVDSCAARSTPLEATVTDDQLR